MLGVRGRLGPDDLAEWRKVWSTNEAIRCVPEVSLAEATAEIQRQIALVARFYETYELNPEKYYTFHVYTGVIIEQE